MTHEHVRHRDRPHEDGHRTLAPHMPAGAEPTHGQLLLAVSGALLASFAALLSSTIVINAMPLIIPDLGGTQTGYTWVVIANMLMLTATMPAWGKLADQFDIARLLKVALLLHLAGGILGACAPNIAVLIGARAVQGIGIGGLSALTAAVIARLVPERERGRFAGYQQISWATGTVSGPLIGGIVADSALGWRGSFLVGLPVAVIALVLMARTLRLPHIARKVEVDYLGAALLITAISLALALVSLGGSTIPWLSASSVLLGIAAVVALGAALHVETRAAAEPIVRLGLFRDRTVALAACSATLVGVALMASTIYLTEYYQYSRGLSPTAAGLLTAPMVCALALCGVVNGNVVARTGRWKPMCVLGCALVAAGGLLIGSVDHATPLALVSGASAVLGLGLGASTANLMLAVQNVVEVTEVGSASSLISFFQALGGTVSITVLGAYLGTNVASEVPEVGRTLPKPDLLPAGLRETYQQVVGDTVPDLFLLITPLLALSVVFTLLIPGAALRSTRS